MIQENLEAWMKCLARASYTYLKMMVSELEMQLQQLNGEAYSPLLSILTTKSIILSYSVPLKDHITNV